MLLIGRKNAGQETKMPAKLTRSGLPRRKPGPKPKNHVDLQAAAQPGALDRCYAAYESAIAAGQAPEAGAEAFRRAMPPMSSVPVAEWASIVAHGIARRALTGKEATQLLYAAQVAHSGK